MWIAVLVLVFVALMFYALYTKDWVRTQLRVWFIQFSLEAGNENGSHMENNPNPQQIKPHLKH